MLGEPGGIAPADPSPENTGANNRSEPPKSPALIKSRECKCNRSGKCFCVLSLLVAPLTPCSPHWNKTLRTGTSIGTFLSFHSAKTPHCGLKELTHSASAPTPPPGRQGPVSFSLSPLPAVSSKGLALKRPEKVYSIGTTQPRAAPPSPGQQPPVSCISAGCPAGHIRRLRDTHRSGGVHHREVVTVQEGGAEGAHERGHDERTGPVLGRERTACQAGPLARLAALCQFLPPAGAASQACLCRQQWQLAVTRCRGPGVVLSTFWLGCHGIHGSADFILPS